MKLGWLVVVNVGFDGLLSKVQMIILYIHLRVIIFHFKYYSFSIIHTFTLHCVYTVLHISVLNTFPFGFILFEILFMVILMRVFIIVESKQCSG